MCQHIYKCFRMVIFGVVISRWPVVSIDCGESRLTVTTDDTCLTLSPLVPFSRTPGSIIRYSCSTLLSGLRESEIDFCPVEICQDNGTWSTASLSCAVNECYQRGQSETYKGRRKCTVNGYACEVWSNHGFSGQDHRYCRDPGGQKGAPWCHINTPLLPVDWEFCDVPICDEKRLETKRCDGEFVESCNLPDMTVKVDHDCTGIKSLPIYSTDVGSTVHFRCSYIQAKLKSSTGYCPIQVCQKDGHWSEASISCGENECYEAGQSLQYQGHRSCTSSGRNCQLWESQYPHAHDLNATSFPDANIAGSYCRDPDGMRGTPWCFTTDPKIEWEDCSIDICNEIELVETQCSFMSEEIGIENVSPPDKYQFQTNPWEQVVPISSFLHRNNKPVGTKSDLQSRIDLHSQYQPVPIRSDLSSMDEPEFTLSFSPNDHLPIVTPSGTKTHDQTESTRNLLSISFNKQPISTIRANGHQEENHLNPKTSAIYSNGVSELSDIQNSYQSAASLFTFHDKVPKLASAIIHSYDQQYVLRKPSVNTQSMPTQKIYNSLSQINYIQIPSFNFKSDHTQVSSPYPNTDFTRVYSSYSKEVSEIYGTGILVQTHSLIAAIDQESYYVPYSDISDVGSNVHSPNHLQDTSRMNDETRYETSHSTNTKTIGQLVASETKEIVLVSNNRVINSDYTSFAHENAIDDTYKILINPVDTILYVVSTTFQLPSIPSKSVLKKHISVFPNADHDMLSSVKSSELSPEFLSTVERQSTSFRTSSLKFSVSVSENERHITAYLENTPTPTPWKSVRSVSNEHPGDLLELATKESAVSLLQLQSRYVDTPYRSVSLRNLEFSIQPSTQEDFATHSELLSNLKDGNDGTSFVLYNFQPSFISIPSAMYAATSPLKATDSKRYINLSSFIPGDQTTNVKVSENRNGKESPQAADTILHDKNMKSSSSSVTLEVASSIMDSLQNGVSDEDNLEPLERLIQYSSFSYKNENPTRVPANDLSMTNFASSKNIRIFSAHTNLNLKQCLVDNGGEDARLDSTKAYTKLGSLDGTFYGEKETEIACGRQCSRVTACDMYTFNLNSKICSLFSLEKGYVHLDCMNYDELACYRRCFST